MYFVTICVKDRARILSEISQIVVNLSKIREVAKDCWCAIPEHFPNVVLDQFVIMPDHIHGFLILTDQRSAENTVGVQYIEPRQEDSRRQQQDLTLNQYQKIVQRSLSSNILCYKAAVTRLCHRKGLPQLQWQRNYYEHIIRDSNDLDRIRAYILNNAIAWVESGK
jgi:putative transposase